jgi:hypothetical protein
MLDVLYSVRHGTKNFEDVRGEAHYFATAIITSISFLKGKALEYSLRNWIEFDIESEAKKIVVGRFDSYSEPPVDHDDNQTLKNTADLMPLILKNPPLARALHDFHSCLSKSNPDFYVFAYRAVEDIRSHFDSSKDETDRKLAWNKMNEALKRKEDDYRELVGFAEQYRHTNMLGAAFDSDNARKQLAFVGSLISDFIQYIKRS